METENFNKNLEMLDELYKIRQESLGLCTKDIKEKLHDISIEELQKILEKSIENTEKRNDILNELDMLIENYEIKMAYFIEQSYKQGFKDAINLCLECKKSN